MIVAPNVKTSKEDPEQSRALVVVTVFWYTVVIVSTGSAKTGFTVVVASVADCAMVKDIWRRKVKT